MTTNTTNTINRYYVQRVERDDGTYQGERGLFTIQAGELTWVTDQRDALCFDTLGEAWQWKLIHTLTQRVGELEGSYPTLYDYYVVEAL